MQHIKFTFILDFIKFIKSVWATAVWFLFLLSSVGFVPKDCFISVNSWHWINHSFLAICSHISMFMLIYSVCANVSLQKIAARQQQQKSHQTHTKKINHFSNFQKKGTLFKLQIEYSFCWYCIMAIFFDIRSDINEKKKLEFQVTSHNSGRNESKHLICFVCVWVGIFSFDWTTQA